MGEFFSEQADYLYFLYGLAFVILGAVCFIDRRIDKNALSLIFFGFFGLVYGLREWLEITALSAGNGYLTNILRMAFELLAFGCLIEFCRISVAQLGGKLPVRRWIYLPMALTLLILGVLYDQAGVEDGVRIVFGVVSSITATIILFLWARKIGGIARNSLYSASLGMFGYGITLALVVPTTSLLATQLIHETVFFTETGIPIQFLRAVIGGWIAVSILSYEIRKLKFPMPRQSVWLMNSGLSVLVMVLLGGFILTNYFDKLHQQDVREHIATRIILLNENISNQNNKNLSPAVVIAKFSHNAAAIRKNIPIEQQSTRDIYKEFLIDGAGVILATQGMNTVHKKLWDTQYPRHPALFSHPLMDGEKILLDNQPYTAGRKIINQEGWSIVVLRQESIYGINRLFAIIMTMLVCVLILILLIMLQKNIFAEIRLRRDHAELGKLSDAFEKQSITDTLTGAYNRLKFDDALQQEIKSARRYQTPLALIMYDIDHFKQINDTYGHQVGDSVLKELTMLVSRNIRSSDMLARWGGEEFMIIVPQDHNPRAQAEKLRYAIASHAFAKIDHLTCSFGVAILLPSDTAETFTARADDALYEAKRKGRNRVEV